MKKQRLALLLPSYNISISDNHYSENMVQALKFSLGYCDTLQLQIRGVQFLTACCTLNTNNYKKNTTPGNKVAECSPV